MKAAFAIALVVLAVSPAAAVAAQPRTTLPDVEDEVMCVECGTALNVSTSPVADQERAFIRRRIAKGQTKGQIKAALVQEYGPRVLATPNGSSFDVASWLVPGALCLLALLGVAAAAVRWRRTRSPDDLDTEARREIDPDDARRLDADLAAFDR